MGNIITFKNKFPDPNDWISMSNGLTDVFINVLALSGAELAETTEEKQLIVWLSEKDQRRVGMGTVDFDIAEFPWVRSMLDEEKQFMIKVIEGAEQKTGWKKLWYDPNEEWLMPCLKQFKEYVKALTEEDIDENIRAEWLNGSKNDKNDPVNNGFPRCEKHDTFLTFCGCQVCNN